MATMQEIFDRIATHLLTQAKKAVSQVDISRGIFYDSCRYRTESGLACAAGCLIPDSVYQQHHAVIEGNDLRNDAVRRLFASLGYGVEQIRLIKECQLLHDCEILSTWPEGLKDIATAFSLKPDIVDELLPSFVNKLNDSNK